MVSGLPMVIRSTFENRHSNFELQHSTFGAAFILAGKTNKKVRMPNEEPKEVRTAKCEWRTEGGAVRASVSWGSPEPSVRDRPSLFTIGPSALFEDGAAALTTTTGEKLSEDKSPHLES